MYILESSYLSCHFATLAPFSSKRNFALSSSDSEPPSADLAMHYIPSLPTTTAQQWAPFQQATQSRQRFLQTVVATIPRTQKPKL